MKGRVKVKTQTSRATTIKDGISNANIIFGNFEMGLSSTGEWGNFDRENPHVELTINGSEYRIPLENFKVIIEQNAIPQQ